jgi:hypothetical protein
MGTCDNLKETVEHMLHCSAQLPQSVPVKETHRGATVWEGVVHVFDLEGHPTATTARPDRNESGFPRHAGGASLTH